MDTAIELIAPHQHAIAGYGEKRGPNDPVDPGLAAQQETQDLLQGGLLPGAGTLLRESTRRLPDGKAHQQCEKYPPYPYQYKGRAPVKIHPQIAAPEIGNACPDKYTGRVDRPGGGAAADREVIRNHGVRRWCAGGFTQPHPDTGEKQLGKVFRKACGDGHDAPHRQPQRNDIAAVTTVSPASNRYAGKGIEQSERKTHQQPGGRVRNTKLFFNWPDKYRQDLAIDEVDNVDDKQHHQHIVGVGG